MLSIIIPVYNEVESLRELYKQLTVSCGGAGLDFEIVFIDDGSNDGSWETIRELSQADERVEGIRFRRNFGKAAALSAGMKATSGEILMMLDADLQDDPVEIPRFLARLNEGFDVVNGWKERRLDPWHKTEPSKVFNRLVGWLTGLKLHDHNCGFKCFRREVAAELRLYGELHRFIPVLAHARGFRVTEIGVHHRPRQHGHSKYGVRRFLRGFLDLLTVKFLTGFGQRPLHILGGVGLGCFSVGMAGLAWLALLWLSRHLPLIGSGDGEPIGGRPLLTYSVAALLLGGQLLSLGLLAELIVANTNREQDAFSIREQTRVVE